ncbi:MAG: lipocalin family protein [Deltaproteobacteria bacterium]|jgi:apolipoprotein D and lipocalin family protein|nr:lipocalin family protein [Deltaproteobacteria bacterium]
MKVSVLFSSLLLLAGCTSVPQGITPVNNFDIERYLGTWYEIARLDHRFERGLSRVSANYSKRPDGGIDVLNRGYNNLTGEWKDATGRAYLLGSPQTASLKVTFFWPFYAGYHVIDLDQQDYSYALISGPDRDYLWLLSRTRTLDKVITQKLVDKASGLGFETSELIFVDQQD